jgi:hypothetical protein
MTYKRLIEKLNNHAATERRRLESMKPFAEARLRTIGRIQGIERAIRAAERLQEERMVSA